MVAVPQPIPASAERVVSRARSVRTLELLQGSLSPQKVARQSPVLAGLHRAADGALIGALMAAALLSAFTLHWQHRWTTAFTRLETTRSLSHRLTESTAMIERHLLKQTNLPESMVPTKVANLLYLERPINPSGLAKSEEAHLLSQMMDQPINHGY
ncbi:MAG: hypothetical protein AB8A40_04335 [Prochlorococcus sp.]|nr:hypothetical protein [Prochlorococcaceae cyanobacterium ETNP14_MAG_4]HJM80404.1 hypothetical protein [Prochlorococcaceae cyanobacterium Fu_MAG_72]